MPPADCSFDVGELNDLKLLNMTDLSQQILFPIRNDSIPLISPLVDAHMNFQTFVVRPRCSDDLSSGEYSLGKKAYTL
jgi:hypothetical protein